MGLCLYGGPCTVALPKSDSLCGFCAKMPPRVRYMGLCRDGTLGTVSRRRYDSLCVCVITPSRSYRRNYSLYPLLGCTQFARWYCLICDGAVVTRPACQFILPGSLSFFMSKPIIS